MLLLLYLFLLWHNAMGSPLEIGTWSMAQPRKIISYKSNVNISQVLEPNLDQTIRQIQMEKEPKGKNNIIREP